METRQASLWFECPGCGSEVEELIDEIPGYDPMADRESDAQGHTEQAATCPGCKRQYSIGITNTGAVLVAELAGEKTRVTVSDDPLGAYNDFLEAEAYQRANLPKDPGQIYKFATYDIDYIGSEVENGPHGSIKELYRMLLVQHFSAIEAYLSDRLITLVLDDPTALSALVKGNKEWVGDKIGVVELASNPDAFRDWVQTRLRELMYHNFAKIDMYYRSALGSTIFPDESTKKTLLEFVPIRHDCVHRYGRDHDGRERSIGKADVQRLSGALGGMVAHLEASFARRAKRV